MQNFTDEQKKYLQIHEPRFQKVLDLVRTLELNSGSDILDIGPSMLTSMLRKTYEDYNVYTFGIVGEGKDGGHLPANIINKEKHFEYDLNDTSNRETWPAPRLFDVIICAEVIEHLYTSPEYVLQFFNSLLAPQGTLILQTPNAAALIKRLTLLAGRNPYELIRKNEKNPGHFREYTVDELIDFVEKAGFTIQSVFLENYFRLYPRTYKVVSYRILQRILGRNWWDGITLVVSEKADV